MARIEDERTRSHAWSTDVSDEPRAVVMWDGGSTTHPLVAGARLLVGRGEDADIKVLHLSISRRHVLVHVGPRIEVEDLGSSNGIRIGGRAVASKRRHVVHAGDIVEFGAAMLMIQGGEPSARPARADQDRFVELLAKSRLSVLIVGETGAGKEVMAERIHKASPRASGPFVRLNVGAMPDGLLESELFGHERGAFTGAVETKRGLIESADQGTLLLDEIGEMPLAQQAKLLRVLETREVRRLGSVAPFVVDVRILSATHRDMRALVSAGEFREDLLYRLNGMTIEVPPLRERPHLIAELARDFLEHAAVAAHARMPRITPAAHAAMVAHPWPGNVRELRNVIERAFVLSDGGPLDAHHLLLDGGGSPERRAPLRQDLETREREQVVLALATANGNQTRAAEALGISRRALINRIESYGLPRPRKKS